MRSTIEAGEADALELFWRRFNGALLDKLALEARWGAAAQENAALRAALQQCLAGVSVTDASLDPGDAAGPAEGGNPLLAVNNRSGVLSAGVGAGGATLATRGGVGGRPPTIIIDGPTTVRTYAAQAGRAR